MRGPMTTTSKPRPTAVELVDPTSDEPSGNEEVESHAAAGGGAAAATAAARKEEEEPPPPPPPAASSSPPPPPPSSVVCAACGEPVGSASSSSSSSSSSSPTLRFPAKPPFHPFPLTLHAFCGMTAALPALNKPELQVLNLGQIRNEFGGTTAPGRLSTALRDARSAFVGEDGGGTSAGGTTRRGNVYFVVADVEAGLEALAGGDFEARRVADDRRTRKATSRSRAAPLPKKRKPPPNDDDPSKRPTIDRTRPPSRRFPPVPPPPPPPLTEPPSAADPASVRTTTKKSSSHFADDGSCCVVSVPPDVKPGDSFFVVFPSWDAADRPFARRVVKVTCPTGELFTIGGKTTSLRGRKTRFMIVVAPGKTAPTLPSSKTRRRGRGRGRPRGSTGTTKPRAAAKARTATNRAPSRSRTPSPTPPTGLGSRRSARRIESQDRTAWDRFAKISSRVGSNYQVSELPECRPGPSSSSDEFRRDEKGSDGSSDRLYHQIWDSTRYRSAIDGDDDESANVRYFLDSLPKHRRLRGMHTLHSSGYDAVAATAHLASTSNDELDDELDEGRMGEPLSDEQVAAFDDFFSSSSIEEEGGGGIREKDFRSLSTKLGITVSRCLVHYYRHYKRSEGYRRWKRAREDEFDEAARSDDGGEGSGDDEGNDPIRHDSEGSNEGTQEGGENSTTRGEETDSVPPSRDLSVSTA